MADNCVPFTFLLKPNKDVSKVEVAGSFNDWARMLMKQRGEEWSCVATLQPGEHQYKFIVDDRWEVDTEKATKCDIDGNMNNVVTVGIETKEQTGCDNDGSVNDVPAVRRDPKLVLGYPHPRYLSVSSSGGASTCQSSNLGVFSLQDQITNMAPAWKKDEAEMYLYVASDGYWGIGSDLGSDDVGIYLGHPQATPRSPRGCNNWKYKDGSKWMVDDTIKVEVLKGQDKTVAKEGYLSGLLLPNGDKNLEKIEEVKDGLKKALEIDVEKLSKTQENCDKSQNWIEEVDLLDSNTELTPLMFAAKNGWEEVCKLLICHGADVNQIKTTTKNDVPVLETALKFAAEEGHANVCEILLCAGADKKATEIIFYSREEIYELLKNYIAKLTKLTLEQILGFHDVNVIFNDVRSLLFIVSLDCFGDNREDIYQMLLEAGVDVNCQDENGFTPLNLAARTGTLRILQKLIDAGADVNRKVKWRGTLYSPIAFAIALAERPYKDCIQLLIEAGSDVSTTTPLYNAIHNGHDEIAKLLIQAGADVTVEYTHAGTFLNMAASKGCSSACEELIKAGVDIDKKDGDRGNTPLLEAVVSPLRQFQGACKSNSLWCFLDVVKQLVAAGADVNKVNDCGGTTALGIATGYIDDNSKDDDEKIEFCRDCVEILRKVGAQGVTN